MSRMSDSSSSRSNITVLLLWGWTSMRDNTCQIRRRDVVAGTDGIPVPQTGLPPGPHPHIHILPCPYYTRLWRADSCIVGANGERMRWVDHMLDKSALYSGRPSSLCPFPYLKCI